MHQAGISQDKSWKKLYLFVIATSHRSFGVSRRNAWINPGQRWTRGQKRASSTAWSDSLTPASLSWTDWNRPRGAGARFPRPCQTKKCHWKDSRHMVVPHSACAGPSQVSSRGWTVPWAGDTNGVVALDASACNRPLFRPVVMLALFIKPHCY